MEKNGFREFVSIDAFRHNRIVPLGPRVWGSLFTSQFNADRNVDRHDLCFASGPLSVHFWPYLQEDHSSFQMSSHLIGLQTSEFISILQFISISKIFTT